MILAFDREESETPVLLKYLENLQLPQTSEASAINTCIHIYIAFFTQAFYFSH